MLNIVELSMRLNLTVAPGFALRMLFCEVVGGSTLLLRTRQLHIHRNTYARTSTAHKQLFKHMATQSSQHERTATVQSAYH